MPPVSRSRIVESDSREKPRNGIDMDQSRRAVPPIPALPTTAQLRFLIRINSKRGYLGDV
jgi:hypothetical protein